MKTVVASLTSLIGMVSLLFGGCGGLTEERIDLGAGEESTITAGDASVTVTVEDAIEVVVAEETEDSVLDSLSDAGATVDFGSDSDDVGVKGAASITFGEFDETAGATNEDITISDDVTMAIPAAIPDAASELVPSLFKDQTTSVTLYWYVQCYFFDYLGVVSNAFTPTANTYSAGALTVTSVLGLSGTSVTPGSKLMCVIYVYVTITQTVPDVDDPTTTGGSSD
jgi:hypothetical protein